MCRFLAYLGPDVSLESLLLAPPWSLLRQSYEPRFMKHGRVNADGFGAGWYDFGVREEPALYRRATPIWSDRTFASIAGLAHSGAILAAVRNATVPSPTEESNTPPYASGRWLFAHNGEVTGFTSAGRRLLLQAISDRRAAEIGGSADSEVLFAMVLDRIAAGAAPAAALSRVVGAVSRPSGWRLDLGQTARRTIPAPRRGVYVYPQELPAG